MRSAADRRTGARPVARRRFPSTDSARVSRPSCSRYSWRIRDFLSAARVRYHQKGSWAAGISGPSRAPARVLLRLVGRHVLLCAHFAPLSARLAGPSFPDDFGHSNAEGLGNGAQRRQAGSVSPLSSRKRAAWVMPAAFASTRCDMPWCSRICLSIGSPFAMTYSNMSQRSPLSRESAGRALISMPAWK